MEVCAKCLCRPITRDEAIQRGGGRLRCHVLGLVGATVWNEAKLENQRDEDPT